MSLFVFLFLYAFHRLQGGRHTGSVGLDHSCVNSGRDSTARSPTAHCGQVHPHGHSYTLNDYIGIVYMFPLFLSSIMIGCQ